MMSEEIKKNAEAYVQAANAIAALGAERGRLQDSARAARDDLVALCEGHLNAMLRGTGMVASVSIERSTCVRGDVKSAA